MELTEGELYYLEAMHIEGGGEDHMTISVEIEQTAIPDHHQGRKEIQELKMVPLTEYEKTVVEITGADDGQFLLTYFHPGQDTYVPTAPLKVKCTTAEMWHAVQPYYAWWGVQGPSITLELLDADGEVTEDASEEVKRRYTITVPKLINSATSTGYLVTPLATQAEITVHLPDDEGG